MTAELTLNHSNSALFLKRPRTSSVRRRHDHVPGLYVPGAMGRRIINLPLSQLRQSLRATESVAGPNSPGADALRRAIEAGKRKQQRKKLSAAVQLQEARRAG